MPPKKKPASKGTSPPPQSGSSNGTAAVPRVQVDDAVMRPSNEEHAEEERRLASENAKEELNEKKKKLNAEKEELNAKEKELNAKQITRLSPQMDEKTLVELLKKNQDKLLNPKDLVGAVTGKKWVYQFVKEEIEVVCNKIKAMHKTWLLPVDQRTQKNWNLFFVAHGQGTGKSRFLTELPRLVHPTLTSLGFTTFIVINVSFENGTAHDLTDPDENVTARFLFHIQGGPEGFKDFATRNWNCFPTVGALISAIASVCDVLPTKLACMICLDGVHQICTDANQTRDNMRQLLRELASTSMQLSAFVVVVASSTSRRPIVNSLANSTSQYTICLPPRLTNPPQEGEKPVLQDDIFKEFWSWTIGHPRAAEAVLEEWQEHVKNPTTEHGTHFKNIVSRLRANYTAVVELTREEIDNVLTLAFTKSPVSLTTRCSEAKTLDEIRAQGLMDLKEITLILSPFWMLLAKEAVNGNLLHAWGGPPHCGEGDVWEDFVVFYQVFRSKVYADTTVPLKELHAGMSFYPQAVGDLEVQVKELSMVRSEAQIQTKSYEDPNFASYTLNARGAKAGDAVCMRSREGCAVHPTVTAVREVIQCKYQITASSNVLNTDFVSECRKAVCQCDFKQMTTAKRKQVLSMLLFITPKSLPDGYPPTERDPAPSTVKNFITGWVHGNNFEEYFKFFAPFYTMHLRSRKRSASPRHRANQRN